MRIVLCYPLKPKHLQQIIAAAPPGAEIVDAGQQRVATELLEADLYCGHAKVPVDWDAVVARGRLQWIQSSAAGMDHCLVPSVVASDIVVTSASGVLADQVAEHTIALVSAWCRNLPVFLAAQARREFVRRPTRDLHGSTVGIVGFGGVGRRLAELLRPYRVRTLATDLYPLDPPEGVDALWPADRLDDLLAQSDIVVLCLPLNDATRGLFDAQRIGRLRSDALLVNMARGPLVVESALVAALREGRLAGACMDVTEVEPLPPESALWDIPGVIITPHVAGQSAKRLDNMTALFCENLRRWQTGEPLINHLAEKHLGFPVRSAAAPLWVDLRDAVLARSPAA